jgi:hypothetical protein
LQVGIDTHLPGAVRRPVVISGATRCVQLRGQPWL